MNRPPPGGNTPRGTPTHFDHMIPDEDREDVMDVVVDDVLTVERKIEMLKNMVNVKALMAIMTYLQTLELSSSSPDDFLSFVTDDRKKRLLRRALTNNDMESLEMLVSKESHQVRIAFDKWKAQTPDRGRTVHSNTLSSSGISEMSNLSRRSSDASLHPKFQQRTNLDDTYSTSQFSASFSDSSSLDDDVETSNEINIHPDFMKKMPHYTNILVLGETGAGKSTFINGLANYLKYGTIQDALKGGVECLIKAFFSLTDDDFECIRIDCEPTISVEHGGDPADNEQTEEGQACTQAPKSYLFTWGPKESKKAIRIIDTPGVGDVRGAHQEYANFGKIMSFVSQFKEIHAICILMKSNNARLNLTFRYCINELLTHLHVSSRENIIWCFTNARQSHFKPGDTLPTLKTHLKKLKEDRNIDLETNRDNIYLFDNEPFRYLCAAKEGAFFNTSTAKDYETSWRRTVEETFRMFKRISKLRPHSVQDMVSLNQIRAIFMGLSKPLVEILRNQLTNAKLIDEKLLEIEDCKRLETDLISKLSVDQVFLAAKEMDYPITVCTAKSCVSYEPLTSDPNGPKHTIYNTECHSRCYLDGVQISICPNPALQQCWALQGDIQKCRTCVCPWETHMHVRYRMEKTMETVTDSEVEKLILENSDKLETAELFVKKQKHKKKEYEQDVKQITSYSAEFAAFIAKNSVLPYNDSFKEYLEHLIKEEKDMGNSDSTMLKSLEKLKEQHEEMIKQIKNRHSSKAKSLEQMYEMIEELKQMKNYGWLLEDVQKLEMAGVRKQQRTVTTAVDLNERWFGKLASKITGGSKAAKFFNGKMK